MSCVHRTKKNKFISNNNLELYYTLLSFINTHLLFVSMVVRLSLVGLCLFAWLLWPCQVLTASLRAPGMELVFVSVSWLGFSRTS